jgi:hypothetical protein
MGKELETNGFLACGGKQVANNWQTMVLWHVLGEVLNKVVSLLVLISIPPNRDAPQA